MPKDALMTMEDTIDDLSSLLEALAVICRTDSDAAECEDIIPGLQTVVAHAQVLVIALDNAWRVLWQDAHPQQ